VPKNGLLMGIRGNQAGLPSERFASERRHSITERRPSR
jgi:hypothetical protein